MTGCGGGGGGGNSPPDNSTPSVVHWRQDGFYIDNSIMNPTTDIKFYNIYINNTGIFTADDNIIAQVGGIDGNGNIIAKFDLRLIPIAFLYQNGIDPTYCMHVAVRSETFMGAESAFSNSGIWGAACYD